jgi:hypothetical protein
MSRRCNICFCFPVKTRAKGESRRQPGPSRELIRQVNRFQTAPSPPKRERERDRERESTDCNYQEFNSCTYQEDVISREKSIS